MIDNLDNLATQALLVGELAAWTELHRILTPRLFFLFLNFQLPASECEELIQETWLRLMRSLSVYDANKPFAPYLFAIATQIAIEWMRKGEREGDGYAPPSGEVPHDAGQETDAVLQGEDVGKLIFCLRQLTRDERSYLAWSFAENKSHAEISAIISNTESVARGHVHRTVRKLLDCMGWPDTRVDSS